MAFKYSKLTKNAGILNIQTHDNILAANQVRNFRHQNKTLLQSGLWLS